MSFLSPLIVKTAAALDRRFGWDRLPRFLGVYTVAGIRTRLRHENLYDTETTHAPPPPPGGVPARYLRARSMDGTYNDLSDPRMGSIGARFGRNVPLDRTFPLDEPAILEPNARTVSRELLTRERFIPATTLNLLAGAWLQFEVHDWFSHGKNEVERPWELELGGDDTWPDRPMKIPRTRRDPTSDDDPTTPPTFVTADSHWWDASQIYGSDAGFAHAIRTGTDGKLRIDEQGLLPADLAEHVDLEGVAANFWLGLGLLHTLFSLEHNAICDALRKDNPSWTDEDLFDRARLVNAALIAKIHTVEWTPAIVAHPTTKLGMNANWWGLMGERFTKKFGRIGRSEVLSGIPGSPTSHHSASVLADRGVRGRLPHASAPAGRLHVPRARRRPRHRRADVPGDRRAPDPRPPRRAGRRELALLLRRVASGRDHAAQLPALPPGAEAARRDGDGPRRGRHHADARARRARATTTSASCSTSGASSRSQTWRRTPKPRRSWSASTATSTTST